jgi:hypothetical protein
MSGVRAATFCRHPHSIAMIESQKSLRSPKQLVDIREEGPEPACSSPRSHRLIELFVTPAEIGRSRRRERSTRMTHARDGGMPEPTEEELERAEAALFAELAKATPSALSTESPLAVCRHRPRPTHLPTAASFDDETFAP